MDWKQWMREALEKAASIFSLNLIGTPVFGWQDRTIACLSLKDGVKVWLRVVTEQKKWKDGDFWTGNEEANQITGIRKPNFLYSTEWEWGSVCVRAEVLTWMDGKICSPTSECRTYLGLSDSWWQELRDSLHSLSLLETSRVIRTQEEIDLRLSNRFGNECDFTIQKWGAAHGDLHWNNMMIPFAILDWEGWGLAPKGYDAATLYVYSLLVPAIARRVYNWFLEDLDTREGVVSQLMVIDRLLHRMKKGDHPDLEEPLHILAVSLLQKMSHWTHSS
ncbi:hypothetical protein J2Z48_001997 [Croceifilum oryzae]|uniref:Uncharacterized protein n=1 Tax=Croceifilum oryzae TaxID=1553429 RepID=A0AAJ1TF96_9BACL|nr:hypothetical protein [Croceifilum oryzae]MDQ0417813.1 hypothetical protein [Croceifilum oryzae]